MPYNQTWRFRWVEVPITVTLDAYTANDVVGGTLSCTVPAISGGGGYIHAIRLIDDATQAEPFALWVFNSAPSTIADGAAHAPTKADWEKHIGQIAIAAADYDTSGTEADCALVYGLGGSDTSQVVGFEDTDDGKLYFRLVPSATPDYADADDLTLHVCLVVM